MRSRGTHAAPTIVQDNTLLGRWTGLGFDGVDYAIGAQITMRVDGTPGSNDMPTKIILATTPDGAQAAVDRIAVRADGTVEIEGNLRAHTRISTQVSSPYVLALLDRRSIVEMNAAGANVVTIPTNATVAFPVGTTITVSQYGVGVTTITGATGVTLNGTSGGSVQAAGQYKAVHLYKRATNEWVACVC
jgi:hypothetical protein